MVNLMYRNGKQRPLPLLLYNTHKMLFSMLVFIAHGLEGA
jgi:hypothetical protein